LAKLQRSRKDQESKRKFRTNSSIRSHKIRLVGEDFGAISDAAGKTIENGVYTTSQALKWAEDMGLDLVEISPAVDPPICKIMDLKKFLYDQKKRAKEIKAKAQKTVIKEIRFGPNTDDHDFDFKTKHAKKFLEDGAKVKAYVHFRGRTIVFKDRGELLLLRFLKELEEYGSAEALPKLEGKRMFVMVAPKKVKK
jgi:translation initiation factor IF-3